MKIKRNIKEMPKYKNLMVLITSDGYDLVWIVPPSTDLVINAIS
jgi:hypothetical protein